jgi:hypothetical protein
MYAIRLWCCCFGLQQMSLLQENIDDDSIVLQHCKSKEKLLDRIVAIASVAAASPMLKTREYNASIPSLNK